MKAIVQNMKTGELRVEEVPAPALRPEGVLVRVERSLISLGTERAVIALAKRGPIGKAKDRPDLFKKVLDKARQEGFWSTYKIVKNLMESPIPLGYSCAGIVIEAGSKAAEFQVGDRVACAGLGFANHAEINYVPRNLAVKIPDRLSPEAACFVTIGAIAMHGVRLAEIELGETVVVMGLGLVGQIACQLARCSGATVLATDLEEDKTQLARRLGAHQAATGSEAIAGLTARATEGRGADAVLICAATKSDEPIRIAAQISRLKGRVVVIGDVGMHIDRRPLFEKEIRLQISRSYGPGRYDPDYEVKGIDYPLPYVRWTERRNMSSFLELAARGEIDVDSLITHRFPIDRAEDAYELVTGTRKEPAVAILLEYPEAAPQPSRVSIPSPKAVSAKRTLRVGVIGAGQFARGILIPAFASRDSVRLHAFCTASGITSKDVATRYKASYCTSDPSEIFQDGDIDAVIIATRHDQHAGLAAQALRAGKAVFVEKPLALNEESLAEIREAVASQAAPRLMVGFNRRFAPMAVQCKRFFEPRSEPLALLYRVNAGPVPKESWVVDPEEGGGRILGEVCHFIDTICFITGALPRRVYAQALAVRGGILPRDNVSISLKMSDDSVGVIQYLGNGDTSVPKEYLEVSGARRFAILQNYRTLSLHANNRRRVKRSFSQAKGHAEEVAAFVQALESGGPMPIDLATMFAVTEATFLIHRSLDVDAPVDCDLSETPADPVSEETSH